MTNFTICGDESPNATFKIELLALWMEEHWIATRPDTEWVIVGANETLLELSILKQFTDAIRLEDGFQFVGRKRTEQSSIPYIYQHLHDGALDDSTGTYIYQFKRDEHEVDVLVVSSYYNDQWYEVTMACVPDDFLSTWAFFKQQCNKFAYPEDEVMVIGGNRRSFSSTIQLDDVILSNALKRDILRDVSSFFERGVATYHRMSLNPFRKLLLAGVPGTGKTMLCNALANWAMERDYRAIYVSSAQRRHGESDGAQFWKVQHALSTASYANKPALIILEEIDAYLKSEEKALILNVLDGSEGDVNPHGTLLVATTNYPEAIDERVLKRPGRLDRVYMIPPIEDAGQASAMLRHYLKELWLDEHQSFASELVGYPGAFVREVVVYALTQLIESGTDTLSLAELEASYRKLLEQIAARDEFVKAQQNGQPPSESPPTV